MLPRPERRASSICFNRAAQGKFQRQLGQVVLLEWVIDEMIELEGLVAAIDQNVIVVDQRVHSGHVLGVKILPMQGGIGKLGQNRIGWNRAGRAPVASQGPAGKCMI